MIKTNSWHYKVANFGSRWCWPGDKVNFCEYCQKVFSNLLILFLLFCVFGSIIALAGISVYQLFRFIFNGIPMHDVCVSFLMFCVVMSSAFTYIFGKTRVELVKKNVQKEPGFFALTYRKFKDKTCFMLKIEDDHE